MTAERRLLSPSIPVRNGHLSAGIAQKLWELRTVQSCDYLNPAKLSVIPSRLLEGTRQLSLRPFGLAERGECLSTSPPRSRPLCRKTKSSEADFCQGQLVVHYLPMSAVDVPKKLHHDCHEGCRAVSMGSHGCRAGTQPKVVTRGPKNLRPTQGWRPVELQTQTSQLQETVDEAIVVQV